MATQCRKLYDKYMETMYWYHQAEAARNELAEKYGRDGAYITPTVRAEIEQADNKFWNSHKAYSQAWDIFKKQCLDVRW